MFARTASILIGLGLLALWIIALAAHEPAWITWLDFVGGCVMLIEAAVPFMAESAVSLIVSLGLFALWIIALSIGGVSGWLTWLTFAAACCALAFAVYVGYGAKHPHVVEPRGRTPQPA